MSTITKDLALAVSRLQQGEPVAIPTETVYGLAANADNEQAILKVFALKNRPLNHPLIMHVSHSQNLDEWVQDIPDYAHTLIEHFWPGPMTLVMHARKGKINPLITGGQSTVAIRCPQHPLAQAILDNTGFPLVAPSANPFGKISPTTAEHVQQGFPDQSLLILDGGRCSVGIESTIIAVTSPEGYQILRHGVIDEDSIQALLPGKQLATRQTIRTPGNLENHYQPEKPLYAFEDQQKLQSFIQEATVPVYTLSFQKPDHIPGYQLPADPQQLAYELYYQLRKADRSCAKIIAIELPPAIHSWEAIRERIIKASTKSS